MTLKLPVRQRPCDYCNGEGVDITQTILEHVDEKGRLIGVDEIYQEDCKECDCLLYGYTKPTFRLRKTRREA